MGWEPANCFEDNLLGGNVRWTSIPSRGSTNTPCRFILQNPGISAGLMGLLARSSCDLGQTLPVQSSKVDLMKAVA